jgi:D-alanine-D-alanine ligase
MNRKKIALVTGGYSGESVISYKSAKTIQENLDQLLWEVYWIDIHKEGWDYVSSAGERIPVNKHDFSIQLDGEKIVFDAVFIGMHGTPGEDGKLQGYFDCLGIPYTSCNAATSGITFNKRYTVAIAAFDGIPVAKSVHLFKYNQLKSADILNQLSLPLFVKPNNGGSSLGISKVKFAEELDAAIEKAFVEDHEVLVEECIVGREFTIGVYRVKGEICTLPITEIITSREFFDYDAKYLGASQEVTPANLDEKAADQIRALAKKAYRTFNASGVVRIDFIYQQEEERPYLLEINTIPGQSEASIIPQQVKAAGMDLSTFYSNLLEESLVLASKTNF